MIELIFALSIPILASIAGYLVSTIYVPPVTEFRKIKGDIAGNLKYYSNVYTSPGLLSDSLIREASSALRRHGTDLISCIQQLPSGRLLRRIFQIPSHEEIRKASSCLIGLSNGLGKAPDQAVFQLIEINEKRAEEVRTLLGIS